MVAGIDPGENQKLREKIDSSTEEMAGNLGSCSF